MGWPPAFYENYSCVVSNAFSVSLSVDSVCAVALKHHGFFWQPDGFITFQQTPVFSRILAFTKSLENLRPVSMGTVGSDFY